MNGFFPVPRCSRPADASVMEAQDFRGPRSARRGVRCGISFLENKKENENEPEREEREGYRERVIFSHATEQREWKNKTQPTRLELARAEPN